MVELEEKDELEAGQFFNILVLIFTNFMYNTHHKRDRLSLVPCFPHYLKSSSIQMAEYRAELIVNITIKNGIPLFLKS